MAFQMLLGLREFLPSERIVDFARAEGNQENGATLLIFQTSKQQTWLVGFPSELCCVLDDIRVSEPKVSWRLPRSQLIAGSEVIIPITTTDYKPATGKLNFGTLRSGWLYSKGLFEGAKVQDKVLELIHSQMGQTLAANP